MWVGRGWEGGWLGGGIGMEGHFNAQYKSEQKEQKEIERLSRIKLKDR